jgi:hypothetical protein
MTQATASRTEIEMDQTSVNRNEAHARYASFLDARTDDKNCRKIMFMKGFLSGCIDCLTGGFNSRAYHGMKTFDKGYWEGYSSTREARVL